MSIPKNFNNAEINPSFFLIGDGCPDEQIHDIYDEKLFTYSFLHCASIKELERFLNTIYDKKLTDRKWKKSNLSYLQNIAERVRKYLPIHKINIINTNVSQEKLIENESKFCAVLNLPFYKIHGEYWGNTLGGYTKFLYENDACKVVVIGPFEHIDINGLKKGEIPSLKLSWKNALVFLWICAQIVDLYKSVCEQFLIQFPKLIMHLDRLPNDLNNSSLQLLQHIIISACEIPIDRIQLTYSQNDIIPDRFIDLISGWYYEYKIHPKSKKSQNWITLLNDPFCKNQITELQTV